MKPLDLRIFSVLELLVCFTLKPTCMLASYTVARNVSFNAAA